METALAKGFRAAQTSGMVAGGQAKTSVSTDSTVHVLAVPGGPDDLVVFAVNDGQRGLGIQGVLKEALEDFFPVSILVGVLFPNERICGDGSQLSEVLLAERSEFEESAVQTRLEVKWHLEDPIRLRCVDGADGETRCVVRS